MSFLSFSFIDFFILYLINIDVQNRRTHLRLLLLFYPIHEKYVKGQCEKREGKNTNSNLGTGQLCSIVVYIEKRD